MTQARARALAPSTKRRMPWIALGLLLVFGSGLAFAAWSRATSTRVAVLVTSHDVAAGQTVGEDMVTTTEVEVGPGVPTLPAGDRAAVVGQVARGPIPAGTLLSREMVTDGGAIPAGQAVVGAVLAPGAYPTAALRPGDPVQLVAAAASGESGEPRRARLGPGVGHHLAGRAGRVRLVRLPAGPAGPGGRRDERRGAPAAAARARRGRVVIWATAGGKGAPGATTLAVLLAWCWPDRERSRIVMEADPDGGVLAARGHDSSGLTHEPGLLSLAAARDGSAEARLRQHAQALGDGVELVAGPPGPAQAEACLRALGEAAAGAIQRAPVNVVVDCGRLHPSSPALPWARVAERTLLVVRPRLDEVVALRPVAERLTGVGVDLGLVCVGDRPFDPVEVAEQAGLPLLAVLPDDPAAAATVTRRGLADRRLRRAGLVRAVERLAADLAAAATVEEPVEAQA